MAYERPRVRPDGELAATAIWMALDMLLSAFGVVVFGWSVLIMGLVFVGLALMAFPLLSILRSTKHNGPRRERP